MVHSAKTHFQKDVDTVEEEALKICSTPNRRKHFCAKCPKIFDQIKHLMMHAAATHYTRKKFDIGVGRTMSNLSYSVSDQSILGPKTSNLSDQSIFDQKTTDRSTKRVLACRFCPKNFERITLLMIH